MKLQELVKRSRVGLKSGRVDWDNTSNLSCLFLVNHGLHAATISEATDLTVSQVHYRCKLAGMQLRDYRNGLGPVARTLVRNFKITTLEKQPGRLSILETLIKSQVDGLKKIQRTTR